MVNPILRASLSPNGIYKKKKKGPAGDNKTVSCVKLGIRKLGGSGGILCGEQVMEPRFIWCIFLKWKFLQER